MDDPALIEAMARAIMMRSANMGRAFDDKLPTARRGCSGGDMMALTTKRLAFLMALYNSDQAAYDAAFSTRVQNWAEAKGYIACGWGRIALTERGASAMLAATGGEMMDDAWELLTSIERLSDDVDRHKAIATALRAERRRTLERAKALVNEFRQHDPEIVAMVGYRIKIAARIQSEIDALAPKVGKDSV